MASSDGGRRRKLLLARAPPSDRIAHARTIRKAGSHLLGVVGDVLDFAKAGPLDGVAWDAIALYGKQSGTRSDPAKTSGVRSTAA